MRACRELVWRYLDGSPLKVALAAAFGAWELLFADFMADDLIQLAVLEGTFAAASWMGPFDLYSISDGVPAHVLAVKDAGLLPWFFDPTFEMRFLRPLSSALLTMDHAIFGLCPVGYRLHGVLWALALVAAVGAMLRRALPGRAGAIALLVFVLSNIHGIFCWTAARHITIAAALGFAALAAHLRWREDRWRPGAVLGPALVAVSLAASEVGVAVAAYFLAYELFARSEAWSARARALMPTLLVLAVYLILWRLWGYGASSGMAGYVDPMREPTAFLRELPARLSVLTGGVVLGGSADLWVLLPQHRVALALGGAVVTLGFVLLLRTVWNEAADRERRAIRWLVPAVVLSAVPFAGTPIGARCLLVPFAGGAGLLAVVIERWWTAWRGGRSRVLGAAGAALAVVHLVLAPVGRVATPIALQWMLADRIAAVVRDAELDPRTMSQQTAIVLVVPDFMVGMHGVLYRALHRLPLPASWRVLSWAPVPHRFTRVAADTLELTLDGRGIASHTLRPGTEVALRDMRATVLAVDESGPTRVRFQFNRSLDDPTMTLLAWRGDRLRRVVPPPLGTTTTIAGGGNA